MLTRSETSSEESKRSYPSSSPKTSSSKSSQVANNNIKSAASCVKKKEDDVGSNVVTGDSTKMHSFSDADASAKNSFPGSNSPVRSSASSKKREANFQSATDNSATRNSGHPLRCNTRRGPKSPKKENTQPPSLNFGKTEIAPLSKPISKRNSTSSPPTSANHPPISSNAAVLSPTISEDSTNRPRLCLTRLRSKPVTNEQETANTSKMSTSTPLVRPRSKRIEDKRDILRFPSEPSTKNVHIEKLEKLPTEIKVSQGKKKERLPKQRDNNRDRTTNVGKNIRHTRRAVQNGYDSPDFYSTSESDSQSSDPKVPTSKRASTFSSSGNFSERKDGSNKSNTIKVDNISNLLLEPGNSHVPQSSNNAKKCKKSSNVSNVSTLGKVRSSENSKSASLLNRSDDLNNVSTSDSSDILANSLCSDEPNSSRKSHSSERSGVSWSLRRLHSSRVSREMSNKSPCLERKASHKSQGSAKTSNSQKTSTSYSSRIPKRTTVPNQQKSEDSETISPNFSRHSHATNSFRKSRRPNQKRFESPKGFDSFEKSDSSSSSENQNSSDNSSDPDSSGGSDDSTDSDSSGRSDDSDSSGRSEDSGGSNSSDDSVDSDSSDSSEKSPDSNEPTISDSLNDSVHSDDSDDSDCSEKSKNANRSINSNPPLAVTMKKNSNKSVGKKSPLSSNSSDEEEDLNRATEGNNSLLSDDDDDSISPSEAHEIPQGKKRKVSEIEPRANIENEIQPARKQAMPLKRKINNRNSKNLGKDCSKPRGNKAEDIQIKPRKRRKNQELKSKANEQVGKDLSIGYRAVAILERAINAAEIDSRSASEGGTGDHMKLDMLDELMVSARHIGLQDLLLDNGLLSVLGRWLRPYENMQLVARKVRSELFDLLVELDVTKEMLEQSGEIGKAINFHAHKDKDLAMRNRADKVLNRWAREVYRIDGNMQNLGDNLREDNAMQETRRRVAKQVKIQSRHENQRQEALAVRPEATESGYIRPGAGSLLNQPRSMRADFTALVVPASEVDEELISRRARQPPGESRQQRNESRLRAMTYNLRRNNLAKWGPKRRR